MTDATSTFFNMTLPLAVVNALIFLRAADRANPFEANVSGLHGFYFNSLCILKSTDNGRTPSAHQIKEVHDFIAEKKEQGWVDFKGTRLGTPWEQIETLYDAVVNATA